MLDRIDYNVVQASEHTTQANVHLEKTVEIERSSRSRSCILGLSTLILIMTAMLILKWTH